MEVIVKTDYKESVIQTLKKYEGKLSIQDLYNVVLPIEKKNKVVVVCVGEDDGEDVYEKPIVVSLADGKVKIEKNNTDIDLRGELIKQGIPDEDILK